MEEKNGAVQTMESKDTSANRVSYFVLEGIMTHSTLTIKRLLWIIVFIAILWAATIGGFLWYISLPVEDYQDVSIENDSGNANYIGNDMNGDFNYGESK